MAKVRLDLLLYNKQLASSREKARAMILAGEVWVNGLRVDKPGTGIDEAADIRIESSSPRYVSRGGLKLEKAITDFNIDFNNKVVLDVGASTGGYTDCALQNGARKVFALDVGYGQLDWSLRNDPRVVNLERKNIRHFSGAELGETVDIITVDVSFISTFLVFPVIKELLKENGIIISLIKPQFEAGKDKVGKKGVVRDPGIHKQVLLDCIAAAQLEGLSCTAVTYSPITGPQGNIEFFIRLEKEKEPLAHLEDLVSRLVEEAHRHLGGKK
ncbi:MAG: TlyA family RNA methyltransferase [Syntrophomonas sp.]